MNIPINNQTIRVRDMDLRDWFAGQALQMSGAFATVQIIAGNGARLNVADLANKAFEIADAMLAAREKQSQ